jgi:hypothetical protein
MQKNRAASSAGWRRGEYSIVLVQRRRGGLPITGELDSALPIAINGEP